MIIGYSIYYQVMDYYVSELIVFYKLVWAAESSRSMKKFSVSLK